MHAKTSLALAACAALAEQALARNPHRHFHRDMSGDVSGDVPPEVLDSQPVLVETIWTTIYKDPVATPDIVSATVTIPVTVVKEVIVPQTTLTPSVRPTQETSSSPSGAALPVKIASTPVADPPPATSSTPSGGSGSKKGIAFEDPALANKFKEKCPDCSWAHSWGTWPGDLDSSVAYYPMLRKKDMATWAQDISRLEKTRNLTKILSFNEPDIATQDFMTAEEAATQHAEHMKDLYNKYKIGAPSVSNSEKSNQGLDWLKQFVDACDKKSDEPKCHYDFCVIHWYWNTANAGNLIKHIGAAYDICKKPIMVNEFGTNGNIDSANFMKKVIPSLDKCPNLTEYSAFLVREDHLMSGPNSLSDSGEAYVATA